MLDQLEKVSKKLELVEAVYDTCLEFFESCPLPMTMKIHSKDNTLKVVGHNDACLDLLQNTMITFLTEDELKNKLIADLTLLSGTDLELIKNKGKHYVFSEELNIGNKKITMSNHKWSVTKTSEKTMIYSVIVTSNIKDELEVEDTEEPHNLKYICD